MLVLFRDTQVLLLGGETQLMIAKGFS